MPAIYPPAGGGGDVNSPPGAEQIYPSEQKAPSPPVRYRTQSAPADRLYPFPITDMPDAPPTGDEQSREVDGDNPPLMAPTVHYATNAPGVGDGGVESKRTQGGDFLASLGLG